MYKKSVSGLFLALFAVSAFASAPAFEVIDVDKDGVVSHIEAAKAGISEEAFALVDTNQDKQLNPAEYTVFIKG